jgi:hypothetical protein
MRSLASFALCACLTLAGDSWAQDVTARAYLDQNQVGLNGQFVLNVEVSGTQQVGSEPELPDMNDFSVYLGSGTSTSMQMAGGRTTVSVTFQYRFQATRLGSFQIGPVRVSAGGSALETEPLTITITDTPPSPQSRQQARGQAGPDIGPDDLFVETEVSKRRAYENEPIVVAYRLYTKVNVSSYSLTRLPSTAGFWVEEYERQASPEVERVVRDGVQYATAVIRKVALFPTGPGKKTIEPLAIEAQVRVQRRSREMFDDFFRMPSLLDERVPVVVSSRPVAIEVVPLPETGRPSGFGGLVGDFDISATVDRTSTATNEALTYTVRIAGEGNIRTVPEPVVEFPRDFEVYPPEISEQVERSGDRVRGSKTFEYVLIPRAPGTRTIPSVSLDYFDVVRGTYAMANAPAIALEITGDATEGPIVIGRPRGGIDLLREDIRFIRIVEPRFQSADRYLVAAPGFWILLIAPLMVVGGALGYRRHRERLEGDVAYARHRRAGRLAKRRLARARGLVSENTRREFYAEVGRALQGFLGDKLNVAEAGLIKDNVRKQLLDRAVSEQVADDYVDCLDVCDRIRFASVESTADEMTAFLERAERAMTDLSRELTR